MQLVQGPHINNASAQLNKAHLGRIGPVSPRKGVRIIRVHPGSRRGSAKCHFPFKSAPRQRFFKISRENFHCHCLHQNGGTREVAITKPKRDFRTFSARAGAGPHETSHRVAPTPDASFSSLSAITFRRISPKIFILDRNGRGAPQTINRENQHGRDWIQTNE